MDNVATLLRDGKSDQVRAQLEQSRANEEHHAEWQYNWGRLREAQGDIAEALHSYEKALELDEDHEPTAFRLAYLLDLHGEDEQALQMYERLALQAPAPVSALINLAVIYEDDGRYDEAHEQIERILEEYPNHPRARLFLKDIESSMSMLYDENFERNMQKRNALLDTPVSDFELSVRSRNCLKKMNINTLGDLLRISEQELLGYKNFGETSLNEIKEMLTAKSLRLGQLKEDSPGQISSSTVEAANEQGIAPELFNKPLSEIELSGRSRKCLQRLALNTLGELIQKTEAELLSTKNFGQTSLEEIKMRLEELGVSLRTA